MKIKNFATSVLLACLLSPGVYAQTPQNPDIPPIGETTIENWVVNIREMPEKTRTKITETANQLRGTDTDKGLLADLGKAVGMGTVSGIVEAIVSETYNLAQYRKRQKQEWMRLIQNENSFVDSVTSVHVMKDFYSSTSKKGALDPSDINFDGIELRGTRNGEEVLYISCSIDKDKIDNLFRHSKFNLVLDTLAFYPTRCHLPNVSANGIRTMKKIKKQKKDEKKNSGRKAPDKMKDMPSDEGDTIIRPGKGGNGFSFAERNNLKVDIDFSIFSSWINEAVQIHKNVELGNFKFSVSIPDTTFYSYSRKDIMKESEAIPDSLTRMWYLNNRLVAVKGDSFVVPRSYMPLDKDQPMWGTGEYNIKVKIHESCQFAENSDKAKNWKTDYKCLRQMQNRSGEVQEYLQTLWNQYGNSMVKTAYKTALSTVATDLTTPLFNGGTSMQSTGAKSQGAAGAQGGMPQAGSGQNPTSNKP